MTVRLIFDLWQEERPAAWFDKSNTFPPNMAVVGGLNLF